MISFGRGVGAQRVQHSLTRPRRPAHPGRVGQHQRERPRARLGGGVGERRFVGGDHLVARVALAGAADQEADRQVLGPLDEVAERVPGVASSAGGR